MKRLLLAIVMLVGCGDDMEPIGMEVDAAEGVLCGTNAGYPYCRYPDRGICYIIDGACECNAINVEVEHELCLAVMGRR